MTRRARQARFPKGKTQPGRRDSDGHAERATVGGFTQMRRMEYHSGPSTIRCSPTSFQPLLSRLK